MIWCCCYENGWLPWWCINQYLFSNIQSSIDILFCWCWWSAAFFHIWGGWMWFYVRLAIWRFAHRVISIEFDEKYWWYGEHFIGLISWGIGAILSLPLSRAMGLQIGRALFQMPLAYQFSTFGLGIWLALVIIIAALASFFPAWRASRLTVRAVLAYE